MARATGKATAALLLRENRRAWLLLRKLEALTNETFRDHWHQGFRKLLGSSRNRRWLSNLLNSIPTKCPTLWSDLSLPSKARPGPEDRTDFFYKRWPALIDGQRDKLEVGALKTHSLVDGWMGEDDWERAILRNACSSLKPWGGETVPAGPWSDSNSKAVGYAAGHLRAGAQRLSQALSIWLRDFWDQGDVAALECIVNGDGVREPWVQQAIAELQRNQLKGTPRGRELATMYLERVGRALWRVGKGQTSVKTAEERRRVQRKAQSKFKALTRERKTVDRLKRQVAKLTANGTDLNSAMDAVAKFFEDDSRFDVERKVAIVRKLRQSVTG
jgi:hypothetical protein